jgi:transposase
LLQKEGFHVCVVPPTKSKLYMQALGLKTKNDTIDAEGLARMGTEQQQPFSDLYQRVYLRTNIKMKGYVAVQNKLLAMMYTLWKRNEMFEPDYPKTIREKEPESSFGLALQKP